ncbi:MAG: phosphoribosyl-AMP cyclohydrolase [Desulfobacterales bacterium]|nr:phosphoribosyl-AMP cyclohydrolase [Desulfobacterales bacterium]
MIRLDFEKCGGLIPTIVQDFKTGEILMLAFMNEDAWRHTLETGTATYWSRTRRELWVKGKTSGHVQSVKEIRIDCDDDTVLLKVEQVGGAACHTGYRSCFFKKVEDGSVRVVGEKIFDPKDVYDGLAKSPKIDGKVKSSRCKARES